VVEPVVAVVATHQVATTAKARLNSQVETEDVQVHVVHQDQVVEVVVPHSYR
jgi:hypothetical protein